MTDTAYSKNFKREVDPEQYVQLLGPDADVHSIARTDVICPVCKVDGASYVRASLGQYQKKAHFRFIGANGISAHHFLCDFYDDRLSTVVSNSLVRFTKDRTKISAIIREWVCAGIQIGLFSQTEMWNMREWFFEKRKQSDLSVKVTWEYVNWLWYISNTKNGIPVYFREEIYKFHPSQATIPGFKWKQAIESEFIRIHQATICRLFEDGIRTVDLKTLQDYADPEKPKKTLLDPSLLRDEYHKTKLLTQFILNTYAPLQGLRQGRRVNGLEPIFRAFSALLLFISDWNFDTAIEKFSKIVNVSQINDLLAGNFIGLNPFTDYQLSEALVKIQDEQYEFVKEDLHSIETSMRNSYLDYSALQDEPLPQLPERVCKDAPPGYDLLLNM